MQRENLSLNIEYVKASCSPLEEKAASTIMSSRETIRNILHGKDSRLLLFIGPCALQSEKSALDYAEKVLSLQKEVCDSFFIVMRAYYEKARSLNSWKGILHSQTEFTQTMNPNDPMIATRNLLISLIRIGVPLAAEFVDPLTTPFFQDLISWGSIGARTIHSQQHRQMASSLSMPCGMKNSLEGSIEAAAGAISIAGAPQRFLGIGEKTTLEWISSKGNRSAHLVLRGSTLGTNYSYEEVEKARILLEEMQLCQSIVIDCSHGNSKGNLRNQEAIFHEIIHNICKRKTPTVKGLMIESFLKEGTIRNKDLSSLTEAEKNEILHSVSHIDPCLSWDTTYTLISNAHSTLQRIKSRIV